MSVTHWRVGKTLRGWAPGAADNRLRHAWTTDKASATGANHRALCGASILPAPFADLFDTQHPRACRRCVKAMGPGR